MGLIESWSRYLNQGGTHDLLLPPGFMPQPGFLPDVVFEKSQIRSRLWQAIAQLPPRERKAIWLYYFAEMTNEEVGAILEVNGSRVSQLRASAIQRLKKLL